MSQGSLVCFRHAVRFPQLFQHLNASRICRGVLQLVRVILVGEHFPVEVLILDRNTGYTGRTGGRKSKLWGELGVRARRLQQTVVVVPDGGISP
jgi:hypothetical protein